MKNSWEYFAMVRNVGYKKHLKKINKWADLTDSDNIGEIIDWLKENIK